MVKQKFSYCLVAILLSLTATITSCSKDEPEYSEGYETDEEENVFHEAVDLGLSVKWATCNVGAKAPSDYGFYFAWGEAETKKKYTKENSKWYNVSYNLDSNLSTWYDAATTNWGSEWRMPTLDEIKELLNLCTWTWTEIDGKNGYEVTGPNGNSIFLPAAGYRGSNGLSLDGSYGTYWSATPYGEDYGAYSFSINSSGHFWSSFSRRYDGQSVRPVTK